MKKVDRLFLGPKAHKKRPIVGCGDSDESGIGPYFHVRPLDLRLQRRPSGICTRLFRRLPSTSWKLRRTPRASTLLRARQSEARPVERDSDRNRQHRFRLAHLSPEPPSPSRGRHQKMPQVARRQAFRLELASRRTVVMTGRAWQAAEIKRHPGFRRPADEFPECDRERENVTAIWFFASARSGRTAPVDRAVFVVPRCNR